MVSSVEPLFLDLDEGFGVICVGRTKGYQLIEEGHILRVKIGRKSLLDVASLKSYRARLLAQLAPAA